MLDTRVIATRLKKLDNYQKGLRPFQQIPLDEYLTDENMQMIVERRLQLSIQACIDIANYLIAHLGLRAPDSQENVFAILGSEEIIPPDLAQRMVGVALGAFGAHALKARLGADALSTFETAVRYQMYHALALLAVALAAGRWPEAGLIDAAGWLFVAGILLFSGSLYLLSLTGARWLGAVAPLGGAAFIAGWGCLALAAWRH